MRIDPADVGDADILADCWVDLAAEQRQYGTHLQAEANRSRIREDLLRRIITGDVLVAREDADVPGGIVGFVSFGVETKSYDQDVTRGVIYNIYVRPNHRDRGVGLALISAAESRLADAGVDVVTLEAMADNEAARRFYERHGYDLHRVELEKEIGDDTADGGSSDVDGQRD